MTAQEYIAADPSQLGGNITATDLKVRYETFEQAQEAKKHLSDTFIDGAIGGDLRLGNEKVGIKGYLDNVESIAKDKEVIESPERIAGLYLRTTEMLARNLKVAVARSSSPEQAQERRGQVWQAKEEFLAHLGEEAPQAANEIVDWCNGDTRNFPVGAVEYRGFKVDGTDVLDAQSKGALDVRPNFKIQRQFGGVFVMAYTDSRVHEKMAGKDEVLDKRIYLNPDMEATPELFEKLLQTANEAGISMQLKMLQRAPEAASAHKGKAMGHETSGLRGDGIVVYVDGKHSDDVLGMVIALAKDSPDAFKDRETSRIPQNVAEGIAVGDEPVQIPGTSLTSHREKIFSYAAEKTRAAGKQGEEARAMFRDLARRTATANGVNPDNIAFNKAT
ncbi:MAG: T3SS effector HopA1 family protein [Candidatus Saccharimonadales bacterium]